MKHAGLCVCACAPASQGARHELRQRPQVRLREYVCSDGARAVVGACSLCEVPVQDRLRRSLQPLSSDVRTLYPTSLLMRFCRCAESNRQHTEGVSLLS